LSASETHQIPRKPLMGFGFASTHPAAWPFERPSRAAPASARARISAAKPRPNLPIAAISSSNFGLIYLGLRRGAASGETAMTQIGTYTLGTFSAKNPTPAQEKAMLAEALALQESDFNLVMLASMHVHGDGSLWFNDTSMITSNPPKSSGELSPNLAQCISVMKAKNPVPGKVLASFGGGGMFHNHPVGYWDFLGIAKLIAQYPIPAENPFFQNLELMFKIYPGIDGLDLDLEANIGEYEQFVPTLVTIIKWLTERERLAVLCPYQEQTFWCDVVTQSKSAGKPTVAWINLQEAVGNLEIFVNELKKAGIDIGQFVGGLQTHGMTPDQVRESFKSIATSKYKDIGGGWLWNLEAFGTDKTAAFASAVATGLGA
jgi:hypothetical protein